MGYAGATYLVQEVCNALFDALFHILPLGTALDKVEADAGSRCIANSRGTTDAKAQFDAIVEAKPVLVRISAAKRLRDCAEREARRAGEESGERSARRPERTRRRREDCVTCARLRDAGSVERAGAPAKSEELGYADRIRTRIRSQRHEAADSRVIFCASAPLFVLAEGGRRLLAGLRHEDQNADARSLVCRGAIAGVRSRLPTR